MVCPASKPRLSKTQGVPHGETRILGRLRLNSLRHPSARLAENFREHLIVRPIMFAQPLGYARIDFLLIEAAVVNLARPHVETIEPKVTEDALANGAG